MLLLLQATVRFSTLDFSCHGLVRHVFLDCHVFCVIDICSIASGCDDSEPIGAVLPPILSFLAEESVPEPCCGLLPYVSKRGFLSSCESHII